MAGRFSVDAIFKAIDKVTAPVRKMQRSVKAFTRSAEIGLRRTGARLSSVRDGFKRVGQTIVLASAIAAAGISNVVATGVEFEQAITNAATKARIFSKELKGFKRLEAKALLEGARTEFTPTEAAQGEKQLLAGGFSVRQTLAGLAGALDFASAEELELETATRVLTKSLGAFGLKVDDSTQLMKNLELVTDVFKATVSGSTATVDSMFEAIGTGAASMVDAGQSIQTTATMIGIMADAAIDGTRAGTALKRVSGALFTGIGKEAKILEKLGIKRVDENKKVRQMTDVMKDLKVELLKMSRIPRLDVLKELFGLVGKTGASKLLEAIGTRMDRLNQAIIKSNGLTKKSAKFQRSTLGGSLKELGSIIEVVKIQTKKFADTDIAKVVKSMTAWIRANEKWLETGLGSALKFVAKNIGVIAAALGLLAGSIVVLTTMAFLVKTLTFAMIGLNAVMAVTAFLFSPIGLAIIGIIALIAGLIIWWDELAEAFLPAGKAIINIWDNMAKVAPLFVDELKKTWTEFGDFFSKWGDGIEDTFSRTIGRILELIDGLKKSVTGITDTIAESIIGTIGLGTKEESAEEKSRSAQFSRVIEERRQQAELLIRDETGRGELNKSGLGTGLKVNLIQSGGF